MSVTADIIVTVDDLEDVDDIPILCESPQPSGARRSSFPRGITYRLPPINVKYDGLNRSRRILAVSPWMDNHAVRQLTLSNGFKFSRTLSGRATLRPVRLPPLDLQLVTKSSMLLSKPPVQSQAGLLTAASKLEGLTVASSIDPLSTPIRSLSPAPYLNVRDDFIEPPSVSEVLVGKVLEFFERFTLSTSVEDMSPKMIHVLSGALNELPSLPKTEVRVYFSAPQTDFVIERYALLKQVYYGLMEYCSSQGLELNLIDFGSMMSKGLRRMPLNSNEMEVRIGELQKCSKVSLGPYFIGFIGGRQGHRPLPGSITAKDFKDILEAAGVDSFKITAHYELDTNSEPENFVLQKIPTNSEEMGVVRDAIENAVQILASRFEAWKEKALLYTGSFSEREKSYLSTILNFQDNSLLYRRHLVGDFENHPDAEKYCDPTESPSKQLHREAAYLPDNIHEYTLLWNNGDVAYTNNEERLREFMETLALDLRKKIAASRQIEQLLLSRKGINLVFNEVLFHAHLVESKAKHFVGNEDRLEYVHEFFIDPWVRRPVVVYGKSGYGKTAFLARVAQLVHSWVSEQAIVAVRFLGSTDDSTRVENLIASLSEQICKMYNLSGLTTNEIFALDLQGMSAYFEALLYKVSLDSGKNKPLVIILDAVDQLLPQNRLQNIMWIPKSLPKYVDMIFSLHNDPTDPENLLNKLHNVLPFKECYVKIDKLKPTSTKQLLDSLLKEQNRKLSNAQRDLIMKHKNSNQPLVLKLLANKAVKLHSFDNDQALKMPRDPTKLVASIFEKLESDHGVVLVSAVCGHITAALNGLSEIELLDALSADNTVICAIYNEVNPQFHDFVRIPQYIWLMLKSDMAQLLTEKKIDSKTLISWGHRQFHDVAYHRYLKDNKAVSKYSSIVAELYIGDNCIRRELELRELRWPAADRLVHHKSLLDDNIRRIHILPHHLILSENMLEIACECLFNLSFLLLKLHTFPITDLLGDFRLARRLKEPDLLILDEFFHMSHSSLAQDPNSLPAQLLGRLTKFEKGHEYIKFLLAQARNWIMYENMRTPVKSIMAPLHRCLPAPRGLHRQTFLGVTRLIGSFAAGKLLVCHSNEIGLQVWRVEMNEVLHFLDKNRPTPLGIVRFSSDKKFIIRADNSQRFLDKFDLETGIQTSHYDYPLYLDENIQSFCITEGTNKIVVGTSSGNLIEIDMATGELVKEFYFDLDKNQDIDINLKSHKTWVNNIIHTQDKSRIVSTDDSKDSIINIWNSRKGTLLQSIQLPTSASIIKHLVLLQQQDVAAVSCSANKVVLVDLLTGMLVKVFETDGGHISSMNESNAYIAVGSASGLITVLHVVDKFRARLHANLYGHKVLVSNTAFTAKEEFLISTAGAHEIKIWHVSKKEEILAIDGHTMEIPNPGLLIHKPDCFFTTSLDGTAKEWDISQFTNIAREVYASNEDVENLKYIVADRIRNTNEPGLLVSTPQVSEKSNIVEWPTKISFSQVLLDDFNNVAIGIPSAGPPMAYFLETGNLSHYFNGSSDMKLNSGCIMGCGDYVAATNHNGQWLNVWEVASGQMIINQDLTSHPIGMLAAVGYRLIGATISQFIVTLCSWDFNHALTHEKLRRYKCGLLNLKKLYVSKDGRFVIIEGGGIDIGATNMSSIDLGDEAPFKLESQEDTVKYAYEEVLENVDDKGTALQKLAADIVTNAVQEAMSMFDKGDFDESVIVALSVGGDDFSLGSSDVPEFVQGIIDRTVREINRDEMLSSLSDESLRATSPSVHARHSVRPLTGDTVGSSGAVGPWVADIVKNVEDKLALRPKTGDSISSDDISLWVHRVIEDVYSEMQNSMEAAHPRIARLKGEKEVPSEIKLPSGPPILGELDMTTLDAHSGCTIILSGYLAFTGCRNGDIEVWHIPDGRKLYTAHHQGEGQEYMEQHAAAVTALAVSNNERYMAVGDESGEVHIWRLDEDSVTPIFKSTLSFHKKAIVTLSISGDNRKLLVGSADTFVSLWRVATAECLCSYHGQREVVSVSVSDTGKRAMLCSRARDGKLRLTLIYVSLVSKFKEALKTVKAVLHFGSLLRK